MWRNCLGKCKAFVKHPSIKNLIATVLGIALGVLLRNLPLTTLSKMFICLPGELLMQFIECVFTLHIVSQVIVGLNGPRLNISKTMAMRAAVYFITTTLIAVTIGALVGMFFKPGIIGEEKYNEDDDDSFSSSLALADLIRNMVPHDLILATFQQYKTRIIEIEVHEDNSNSATKRIEQRLAGEYIEGVNILGLLTVAVVVGICLRSFGEDSQMVMDIFTTVNQITKEGVHHITVFFPVGLLFMTAKYIDEVGLDLNTFVRLEKFSFVAFSGFLFHGVFVLPLIYLLLVRRNPLDFIKGIYPALRKAMRFSRSSATQLAIQCCEDVNSIDKRVTRFILPRGNQNGTALYIMVSVIFVSQVSRIYLNWNQLLILAVTVAVTRYGEADTPATESAITIFTLKVLGIPARNTCLVLIIEWALDCLSCPLNTLGDCIGAAVVAHLSRKELEEMHEQEEDVLRSRPRLKHYSNIPRAIFSC